MAVTAPRMWGILQFFLSPETCLRRPGKQLSDLFCLKRGIVGNMECLDFIVSIHPWSNHKPLLQRAPITSFHTWFTYIFIICFTREGGYTAELRQFSRWLQIEKTFVFVIPCAVKLIPVLRTELCRHIFILQGLRRPVEAIQQAQVSYDIFIHKMDFFTYLFLILALSMLLSFLLRLYHNLSRIPLRW